MLNGTTFIIGVMLRRFYFLWLPFIMLSCNSNKSISAKKTLDFGSFTIETPIAWNKIEAKGVDSYVGGILIDSAHVASFDLGRYSNDLSEYLKVNLNDTTYTYMPTDNIPPLYVDSTHMEKLKKCKVVWDTIDNHLAKIVIPINQGFGVTGIYFDSLWKSESGEAIKFQMSANNLTSNDQTLLIQAFKSLHFISQPK